MKLFTKSMEPNTTLGVAERVAYMSGNIGIALINTIVATFLMFFYTDVMMLNAGIIGTILMVSRLFDGVTDIIMGMIVDRTHSKYGKARVWVIRTCIPYAISGLLLVCVPGGMTELVQYIYVFITSAKAGDALPKDADANGAYCIALKGLYEIKQITENWKEDGKFSRDKLKISNKDWFDFIQNKRYL